MSPTTPLQTTPLEAADTHATNKANPRRRFGLRAFIATLVVGLFAGLLVSTVGPSIGNTQEVTQQFNAIVRQSVSIDGLIIVDVRVIPGEVAASGFEGELVFEADKLALEDCDSTVTRLVACRESNPGVLTIAAVTSTAWDSNQLAARLRFRPLQADSAISSVTLTVFNAVDAQTAAVQGPTVPRTVDVTTLPGDANCDGQRDPSDALGICLLYTSPSPRDATLSRMPSSA